MKAAFDDSAKRYDEDFTLTSIGRLQRKQVWHYLETTFAGAFPKTILELNCGTGEDAVFFAKHGAEVLATDISENMLEVTNRKIERHGFTNQVFAQQLDITQLCGACIQGKYELVFSNFGGVNCISPAQLEELFQEAGNVLQPRGRVIMVIMPRFCAWETLYFISRLDFKKAFRRRRKGSQEACLPAGEVDTWYHSPAQVKKMAEKYYQIKNIQPIGISIPPSYLEKTFLTKRGILGKLNYLENKLNRYPFFSGMADHFLIDLELK